jgi:hypothetical protein
MLVATELPVHYQQVLAPLTDYDFVIAPVYVKYPEYRSFNIQQRKKGRFVILDNGAFEGELLDEAKLVRIIQELHPQEVVAPDVIGDRKQTYERAIRFVELLDKKRISVRVQVCPQGRSFVEWTRSYKELVDLKGVSTIGCSYVCLTGDTRISRTNGTEVAIKNLVGKDPFWVYSYDHETGKIVPGKATARKTRANAELVEVELDNGEKVKCTPGHKWMLRDGSYKAARDLQPGESLMPLYRRYEKGGYEQVCRPSTGGWRLTHVEAAGGYRRGFVIHHRDFNKCNNDPDNLVHILPDEHLNIHARPGKISVEGRRSLSEMRRRWHREKTSEVEEQRRRRASETQRSKSPEEKAERLRKFRDTLYLEGGVDRLSAGVTRSWQELTLTGYVQRCKNMSLGKQRARRERADLLMVRALNHRVVAVRILEERGNVYDLTVEKYHNFALSAGVFVHNCHFSVPEDCNYFGQIPPQETVRLRFFHYLVGQGLLREDKQHHLLGLVSPAALKFYRLYPFIRSIDTSFPVIGALHLQVLTECSVKYSDKLDYGRAFNDQELQLAILNILKLKEMCR